MQESTQAFSYHAKTRFQCPVEAVTRRKAQGEKGQRFTRWAVREACSLAGDGLILDLACGNGRHLPELRAQGQRVLGADISEAMLDVARRVETGGVEVPVVRMEAEHLPFGDRSVDVVFSARFFHHLPNRAIQSRILAEIFRVSRKGAVITYKANFTYEQLKARLKSVFKRRNHEEHRYFMSHKAFEEIAAVHGWRVAKVFSLRGLLSANRAVLLQPVVDLRRSD